MTDFDRRLCTYLANEIIKTYKVKPGISDKEIEEVIYRYAFNHSDGPGEYYGTMNKANVIAGFIKKKLERKEYGLY